MKAGLPRCDGRVAVAAPLRDAVRAAADRLVVAARLLVRIPAPYNEQQIEEHLAQLSPHVRANLDVVTVEVVAVRRAADERPTDPCPPMSDAEALERFIPDLETGAE